MKKGITTECQDLFTGLQAVLVERLLETGIVTDSDSR